MTDSKGFTITEVLVAALFAVLIIATLYGFFREQLFHILSQETRTATLEDARGALDMMVRDLRNAGAWGSGSAPAETTPNNNPPSDDDPNNPRDADTVCNRVYAATKKLIHVQMNLNNDSDCIDSGDNIKYELAPPTSTCPGPYMIKRNDASGCLVANVSTPVGTEKLFTYYDATGTDLGDNPVLTNVKRVKITFSVEVKNPNPSVGGNVSTTLSSSVEFRN